MDLTSLVAAVHRPLTRALHALGTGPRPTRGPELIAGTPVGTGWSVAGTGASVDAGGGHFVAAASLATIFHAVATEDNATYEITYTIANFTGGGVRVLVYGATTAHAGGGVTRTSNGTFTEQVTTSAAGSSALRLTFQATVSSTGADILPTVSLRKVLP